MQPEAGEGSGYRGDPRGWRRRLSRGSSRCFSSSPFLAVWSQGLPSDQRAARPAGSAGDQRIAPRAPSLREPVSVRRGLQRAKTPASPAGSVRLPPHLPLCPQGGVERTVTPDDSRPSVPPISGTTLLTRLRIKWAFAALPGAVRTPALGLEKVFTWTVCVRAVEERDARGGSRKQKRLFKPAGASGRSTNLAQPQLPHFLNKEIA